MTLRFDVARPKLSPCSSRSSRICWFGDNRLQLVPVFCVWSLRCSVPNASAGRPVVHSCVAGIKSKTQRLATILLRLIGKFRPLFGSWGEIKARSWLEILVRLACLSEALILALEICICLGLANHLSRRVSQKLMVFQGGDGVMRRNEQGDASMLEIGREYLMVTSGPGNIIRRIREETIDVPLRYLTSGDKGWQHAWMCVGLELREAGRAGRWIVIAKCINSVAAIDRGGGRQCNSGQNGALRI